MSREHVNTARSSKQTVGSSGEQQLNGYRDVCIHSGRYVHRSSVKTNKEVGLAVNNNTTVKPHRKLYIRAVRTRPTDHSPGEDFSGSNSRPNVEPPRD